MATKKQMQQKFDDWVDIKGGVTMGHVDLAIKVIQQVKDAATRDEGCSKKLVEVIQNELNWNERFPIN